MALPCGWALSLASLLASLLPWTWWATGACSASKTTPAPQNCAQTHEAWQGASSRVPGLGARPPLQPSALGPWITPWQALTAWPSPGWTPSAPSLQVGGPPDPWPQPHRLTDHPRTPPACRRPLLPLTWLQAEPHDHITQNAPIGARHRSMLHAAWGTTSRYKTQATHASMRLQGPPRELRGLRPCTSRKTGRCSSPASMPGLPSIWRRRTPPHAPARLPASQDPPFQPPARRCSQMGEPLRGNEYSFVKD